MRLKVIKHRFKGAALAVAAVGMVAGSVVAPPPIPEYAAFAKKRTKFKDECKSLRKPFSKIKNKKFEGTAIGAVLGVGLGFLLGGMIKGKEKVVVDKNGNRRVVRENRAAEGAVIGGLAGAGVGRTLAAKDQEKARAALQKALNGQEQAQSQYSDLPQKLADLGNCRNAQIYRIGLQVDSNEITPEEAEARMQKVEAWIAKDDEIIEKAAKLQGESITAYAQTVAMSEGESYEAVKDNPDAMFSRYNKGTARYRSGVDVTYAPATESGAVQAQEHAGGQEAYIKSSRGANMRSEPSKSAPVIKAVPYREKVLAEDSSVSNWSFVTHGGQSGYIASRLLSASRPSARPTRSKGGLGTVVVRKNSNTAKGNKNKMRKAVANSQSFNDVRVAVNKERDRQKTGTRSRIAAAKLAAQS